MGAWRTSSSPARFEVFSRMIGSYRNLKFFSRSYFSQLYPNSDGAAERHFMCFFGNPPCPDMRRSTPGCGRFMPGGKCASCPRPPPSPRVANRSGARAPALASNESILTAPITQTGHHIPVGNAFLPAFDRSYITTVTA